MARELHVTSPMMRGPDVAALQTALQQLGLAPGPLDDCYGPATARAVMDFQRAHSLVVDGIVGPATQAAIMLALQTGTPLPVISGSELGGKALSEAIKHLGVKEDPPDSNNTEFGLWYGANGLPWCNIFVSYCFQIGAGYTLCDGFKGAGVKAGKGCAYVPTTEAWLRATGMWVGRAAPKPGDIAIFNWDGKGAEHIGIVELDLGGGNFQTIEGNTSTGNDSNGGEVMRRQRRLSQVDGFGRVIA